MLIFFSLLHCFLLQQSDEEPEGRGSSDEESSDDEHTWSQEVKEQHR